MKNQAKIEQNIVNLCQSERTRERECVKEREREREVERECVKILNFRERRYTWMHEIIHSWKSEWGKKKRKNGKKEIKTKKGRSVCEGAEEEEQISTEKTRIREAGFEKRIDDFSTDILERAMLALKNKIK